MLACHLDVGEYWQPDTSFDTFARELRRTLTTAWMKKAQRMSTLADNDERRRTRGGEFDSPLSEHEHAASLTCILG